MYEAPMQKKEALAGLLQSKFVHDTLQSRQDANRRAKLKAFLAQHQHASQWATCIAALEDALQHNVLPTDEMICHAITQCGRRNKLGQAKELYTSYYKRINRRRPLEAHVAFMGACADSADFKEAHKQFQMLKDRDVVMFKKDPSHRPIVTDDVTTEYLRSALASCVRDSSHSTEPSQEMADSAEVQGSGSASAWETALAEWLYLRRDTTFFRRHNDLTPLLVENAAQLAELGGQWELCLRILKGCAAEQVLIPPEAYDAAIRACYHHGQHVQVVDLMRKLVATKTPPDERSVRLALTSSEEVAAIEREAGVSHPTSWALSLVLFEAMQQNGLVLHQQSYEAPLRACSLAGKWEGALLMLKAMRRDGRPVSSALYRVALAPRVEACGSYQEARRFLELPVATEGGASSVLYLSALRCCMRHKDWAGFERLNREMKDMDMPESYDKMRLLIEAAYLQQKYHSALMRFARFDSVTSYERERVVRDRTVRLFDSDFDVSERLLDMVLDAYTKIKQHKDPMVEVAYQRALTRKQRGGAPQLHFSSTPNAATPPEAWMFSSSAREERTAPKDY